MDIHIKTNGFKSIIESILTVKCQSGNSRQYGNAVMQPGGQIYKLMQMAPSGGHFYNLCTYPIFVTDATDGVCVKIFCPV